MLKVPVSEQQYPPDVEPHRCQKEEERDNQEPDVPPARCQVGCVSAKGDLTGCGSLLLDGLDRFLLADELLHCVVQGGGRSKVRQPEFHLICINRNVCISLLELLLRLGVLLDRFSAAVG